MPEYFELSIDYASYRPVDKVTFAQVIDLCNSAVAFARLHEVKCLLVDTTQLTGFGPPSTLERFEFAHGCATAAEGKVKVAFLARPENIDPNGFGLAVARNRGFWTGIFASEADAVQWLLDPNSP
jgi:hypothetical protein